MSKSAEELEIKKLRISCATYVGAWMHGNPDIRAKFKDKQSILEHFENLIDNLKEKQQAKHTTLIAAENASKEVIAQTNIVTDFSQYKLDWIKPDRKRNIELRNWQKAAADNLFVRAYYHKMLGQLLLSGVGTGKTMMVAECLSMLIDSNWHKDKLGSFAPYPYLVVTKASVVEQFKSDLEYRFGVNTETEVLVTNYEQLRSKFGEQFIKEETIVVRGEPEIMLRWKPYVHPAMICWDECHSLKREDSIQSKIALACNDQNLKGKIYQIMMSATPFTRIADCKAFTLACNHSV